MDLFAYTEPGWQYPAYVNMATPTSPDDPDAGKVTIIVRGAMKPGSPAVAGQARVPPRPAVTDEAGNEITPAFAGVSYVAPQPEVPAMPGDVASVTVSTTEFFSGVLVALAGVQPGGTFSHPAGVAMYREPDGAYIRLTVGGQTVRIPQDQVRRQGEAIRENALLTQRLAAAAAKGVVLSTETVAELQSAVLDSVEAQRRAQEVASKAAG